MEYLSPMFMIYYNPKKVYAIYCKNLTKIKVCAISSKVTRNIMESGIINEFA
jgi:hypothetical protein